MTKITYYVAADGKRFDNEIDCYQHELTCSIDKYANDIILLEPSGEVIPLDIARTKDISFIKCRTDAAASFLRDYLDGLYLPWDYTGKVTAGSWYYEEGADCWTEDFQSYIAIAEIMKKFINM